MYEIPAPERLLEVFRQRRPLPLKLEIRPTKNCNLHCRMCWRQPIENVLRYDQELPPERFVELIREGVRLGARRIELVGGGEPTLNQKAAMTYFREIKAQEGVYGDLVTNGTRFTEEMIREMVELKWDRIMFSVDGANADTHDYVRGKKGAFDKTITAIERFTHWKRVLGADRPLLGMVPVLTNRNHTQFSDYLELARRLGVYHVGFKPLVHQHEVAAALQIEDNKLEEMNRHIEAAIPLAKRLGIETNLQSIIHRPGNEVVQKSVDVTDLYTEEVESTRVKLGERFGIDRRELTSGDTEKIYKRFLNFVQVPCYLPWIHLTITPEGNVLPCTGAGTLKPIPNVRDSSLEEILFGKIFTKFRQDIIRGEYPGVCHGCCVGLFLDNREHRRVLMESGARMMEEEARQIKAEGSSKRMVVLP